MEGFFEGGEGALELVCFEHQLFTKGSLGFQTLPFTSSSRAHPLAFVCGPPT